jgi:hypothetical protein
MDKPVFEVEIRMDVPQRRISDIQFDKRTRDTVAILERSGPVEYRRITHPMSFTTMRLFMARVQASTWDVEALYGLSERLHQDYISVYSPSRNEGAYIGPCAVSRGEFELRCFSRFDPEAVRREAMVSTVSYRDGNLGLFDQDTRWTDGLFHQASCTIRGLRWERSVTVMAYLADVVKLRDGH